MSTSTTFQLYDLASRDVPPRCWSYNVWKTRLAFAYKSLPYTTIWVNHNTIKPTLSALGVRPNDPDQVHEYTVPTVKFLDGTVITDSAAIAFKLEDMYPTPSLHLDRDLEIEVEKIGYMVAMPLFAEYLPRLGRDVIIEETLPAYRESREKHFGMSLEELQRTRGGEQAWRAAEPGFAALKKLLTERRKDKGPFILGSQVCYADFLLVAFFGAFGRVGEDMFERAVGYDRSFGELYEASKVWLENDQ